MNEYSPRISGLHMAVAAAHICFENGNELVRRRPEPAALPL